MSSTNDLIALGAGALTGGTGGIIVKGIDLIGDLGDLFGDMKADQKLGVERIQKFVTENNIMDSAWVSEAVEGAKKYSGTGKYWTWWRGKQKEYLDKIEAEKQGIDENVFWENDSIFQTTTKADAVGDMASGLKSLVFVGAILGLGYAILKGRK